MSRPGGPISKALIHWAESKQQFLSAEAGWTAFLEYLDARHGADIDGEDRLKVKRLIGDLADRLEDDPSGRWRELAQLEARADVQRAFRAFTRERGLLLPEEWPVA